MVDFCGHDENYVPDVRFTGQKAMVLRSATQHVHNGGSGGICEPIGHAPQVRAGGSPVIRHGDAFWMDNRKTVGEAQFVRDTATYPAPKDNDPIPGSLAGATTLAFLQRSGGAVLEPPATVPAPAPVRPPAPSWFEPPPEPPPLISGEGAAEGLAKYGKWGGAFITGAIILLVPTNKAVLDDVIPQDDYERGVVKQFYDSSSHGADSWKMRDWAMKEIQQHRRRVAQKHEGPDHKRLWYRKATPALPASVDLTARTLAF